MGILSNPPLPSFYPHCLVHLHTHKRHLHILPTLIIHTNLKDQVLSMRRNRGLRHKLDQLAHSQPESLVLLLLWEEARIKQTNTGAQHRHLETLLLHGVQELLKSEITVVREAVPELVDDNFAIFTHVLALGTGDGLGEGDEGEREVYKAVFVDFEVGFAVDELVEFETDETGDEGGRGSCVGLD